MKLSNVKIGGIIGALEKSETIEDGDDDHTEMIPRCEGRLKCGWWLATLQMYKNHRTLKSGGVRRHGAEGSKKNCNNESKHTESRSFPLKTFIIKTPVRILRLSRLPSLIPSFVLPLPPLLPFSSLIPLPPLTTNTSKGHQGN